MKIEVNASELLIHVGDLEKMLKATELETVTVKAEADGSDRGAVTVRGSCGGNTVELRISTARCLEPGSVALEIGELERACGPYLRDTLTVSASGDLLWAFVECGADRIKLEPDVENVPVGVPPRSAPRAVFDRGDFLAAMGEVEHAMSDDITRRSLCGINFEVGTDMKLLAVASDGRALATCSRQLCRVEVPSASYAVWLPRVAVEFVARAMHGKDIAVTTQKNRLWIATGGSSGVFGLCDELFPNWRGCVPKDPPLRATFDAGELAGALTRAATALQRTETDADENGETETYDTPLKAHIFASAASGMAEITVCHAGGNQEAPTFFTTVKCTTPDAAEFEVDVNADYLRHAVRSRRGKVEVRANLAGSRCNAKQLGPLSMTFPDEPHITEILVPLRVN